MSLFILGSKAVSCENGVLETSEVQKKKRDDIFSKYIHRNGFLYTK